MKVPSLRRRLTVIIAAALVTIVAATGIATTLVLRSQLEADLDRRLNARIVLARTLRATTPPADLASQLSDRDISVVIGTPSEDTEHHSPHAGGRTAASTLADGTPITFIEDEDSIDDTITRLVGVETIVGAVALVALVALASWSTRRALSPVDHMVDAAEQIAGGTRGARLRPERPDTELGRLATSIDAMIDSLERSESRMRRFVADASHELRTPTAGIQATAESFVDDDSSGPERDRRVFDLVAGTHRLTRLVNDLLDLERIDNPHHRDNRDSFDLAQLADQLAATHTTTRNVTIKRTGDRSTIVHGHRDRLDRAITNLLDNAARHAPDNTAVTLDVRTTAGTATVTVSDRGPGIPTTDSERIFDRFTRLDPARTTHDGGTGLGLAISRAIAAQHAGTLHCEPPTETPGARFVLRLPRDTPTNHTAS